MNYSNKLNKFFVLICTFCPIIYASWGWWAYSNRQIFENIVYPRYRINGYVEHRHTVVYSLTTLTPGTPMLILLFLAILNFVRVVLKYSKFKI